MRFGELCVQLDRVLVRVHGFALAALILERDSQIERREGASGIAGESGPVFGLRGGQVAGLMQQTAEVDPGLQMLGSERQHAAVRLGGLGELHRLQVPGEVVPCVGVERLGIGAFARHAPGEGLYARRELAD